MMDEMMEMMDNKKSHGNKLVCISSVVLLQDVMHCNWIFLLNMLWLCDGSVLQAFLLSSLSLTIQRIMFHLSLCVCRLSKELQQKDKIIESLHTKLQQRPDTPSSSHAPSETTDQSDRTSFVSDERASINEDLELCSDVDAVSEYAQEEPAPRSTNAGMWTDTVTHTGIQMHNKHEYAYDYERTDMQ